MPCALRKRRVIREFSADVDFQHTTVPKYDIIRADNLRIFAFNASIGTSETWKVQMCVPNEVMNASIRAHPSSVGHTGLFQGLRRNADEDCALFLCP